MATQPKFTPGPWSVDLALCGWILHGRRPQDVIAATDHDQHLSNREIADARLLSAAPDLRDAVIALLEDFEALNAEPFSGAEARAALRKADGDA